MNHRIPDKFDKKSTHPVVSEPGIAAVKSFYFLIVSDGIGAFGFCIEIINKGEEDVV